MSLKEQAIELAMAAVMAVAGNSGGSLSLDTEEQRALYFAQLRAVADYQFHSRGLPDCYIGTPTQQDIIEIDEADKFGLRVICGDELMGVMEVHFPEGIHIGKGKI